MEANFLCLYSDDLERGLDYERHAHNVHQRTYYAFNLDTPTVKVAVVASTSI